MDYNNAIYIMRISTCWNCTEVYIHNKIDEFFNKAMV